ncbi:histidine phosphatase family protein [Lacibacterium aquatile]|uniref:Histidine phosphatase family protein n=1 Tax=Lacibacterium aquatile TaxID=1168082 RepID=A0ABW5DTH0_9PROT
MILLLRHGQTEWNRDRRLQGQGDSPLTALGRAQARAMGRTARTALGAGITPRLMASPLGRTLATADLVAFELGISAAPVTDPRLMELAFGSWEGRTGIETLDTLTHLEPHWRYFHSPDGETHPVFVKRISGWLEEFADGPEPLVVVSHGLTGQIIRGVYGKLDDEATLRQDHPQDAIFKLQGGIVERLACEPVEMDLA